MAIILVTGTLLGANYRILKSELPKHNIKRIEPEDKILSSSRDECPVVYPNNPNSFLTQVDESANGYGMVSTVTRPIDVSSSGNWLTSYRQYAGPSTTHGQVGAAYSNDGTAWDIQYNLNYNGAPPWGGTLAQGRYPSVVATSNFPYVFWNEYTYYGVGYGGRPYYSYDEFGWGGQSWMYPIDVDPLWSGDKDLWTGSVAHGFDASSGEQHVSAVYDDWTRTGSYLFTSEAVVGGYIVFGTETLVFNPNHLGTDGYSSSAILSMNDNGQGIMGIDGIFAGNDMDAGTCGPPASNPGFTCNKVPMFKLTDNYGQTWAGNQASFDYYFTPDEIFDDIFSIWPSMQIDHCTGEVYDIIDYWSWYEFDMRVDQDGNPHFVISLIPESDNYFHFIDGISGFYHLTIDRDNVASPGPVNSPTGWNWSYISIPTNNSFVWNRPDGYSYLYGAMAQISLSRENPDIVYIVSNIAEKGEINPVYDEDGDGVVDDPCAGFNAPNDLYPNWSEDIWVAKSIDNGSTWTNVENLTQTPRTLLGAACPPEEQYVHTAHWSDDNSVRYVYQQPDWSFNEIGDPLGADHKNRVFVGYSFVEDGGSGCTNALGDINEDGSIDVLDIVAVVNEILVGGLSGCALEAADFNTDGSVDVLDIVAMVSLILGNRGVDATSATIQIYDGALLLKSDGYIGGVQMTLQHNKDFSIELTDNALVAEYRTVGNETKFVIVVPEVAELFTFEGDFEIVDIIVANSEGEVNVDMLYAPTMVTEFSLSRAYPNPFNPTTTLSFALPIEAEVSLSIYNLQGRMVEVLTSGNMQPGQHSVTWNADAHTSGVYFVKMVAGEYISTQKLILMK